MNMTIFSENTVKKNNVFSVVDIIYFFHTTYLSQKARVQICHRKNTICISNINNIWHHKLTASSIDLAKRIWVWLRSSPFEFFFKNMDFRLSGIIQTYYFSSNIIYWTTIPAYFSMRNGNSTFFSFQILIFYRYLDFLVELI